MPEAPKTIPPAEAVIPNAGRNKRETAKKRKK
jgi:hypothetical protein